MATCEGIAARGFSAAIATLTRRCPEPTANVAFGSIASFERRRPVCFNPNYGRITATQRTDALDESPGGISPPGAPKTVREPLDSHGSRCSTVGKRAAGFTSSTGSSCCQLASVGRWSRLNNAAPSVQLHYRAFVPTTSHSAPVLRIGTLVLAVVAACDFSLYIGAQVLTFRTKAWLSFAPPPCRMPLGPSQASPKLIPKEWPPPGFGIA